jgi:hypothetical protein
VTAVSLLSKGINEVLFPLGCAIVLYFAEVMRGYVPAAPMPSATLPSATVR